MNKCLLYCSKIFQDCVDGAKDVAKGFIKSNGSKEDSYVVLKLGPDASQKGDKTIIHEVDSRSKFR
jgi:hypothetical protein